MALKFSKEKKDPTQKLINFGFKSLLGPIGTAGVNYVKNKIVKNITPYGYDNPLTRIKDAVLYPSEFDDIGTSNDVILDAESGSDSMKERRDLLSMMMIDKQQHNSVPISKYKPTNSKNKNTVYYSSPSTESNIKSRIKEQGIENVLSEFTPNKKGVPTWQGYGEADLGGSQTTRNRNVLGTYTMNQGEDEEGKYLSYYDKWDLNPFEDKNKILDAMATGAQYAAGIKPAEVYGRVYYEPKLKSPIFGLKVEGTPIKKNN